MRVPLPAARTIAVSEAIVFSQARKRAESVFSNLIVILPEVPSIDQSGCRVKLDENGRFG
jgi:hypothetical protein